jgi:hypothetical protein
MAPRGAKWCRLRAAVPHFQFGQAVPAHPGVIGTRSGAHLLDAVDAELARLGIGDAV